MRRNAKNAATGPTRIATANGEDGGAVAAAAAGAIVRNAIATASTGFGNDRAAPAPQHSFGPGDELAPPTAAEPELKEAVADLDATPPAPALSASASQCGGTVSGATSRAAAPAIHRT